MDVRFDALVIGGGINGAGIARDAAGRGYSVLLVEQEDLAQHTSSASTKLIHGGLRYLEHGEFRLVREALIERDRLLGLAPHLIEPLEFVLPQAGSPRPAWMVRLGLLIYDRLGGHSRRLPASRRIRIRDSSYAEGLRVEVDTGFRYYDCRVDDSRLVLANALDAAERGADVRTRTRFVRAARVPGGWDCTLRNSVTGAMSQVTARALVNAAGPWVSEVLNERVSVLRAKSARLVKGSHIVVPRLYSGDHAFMLQNPDRRVIFVVPYEQRFSLIGTTDVTWDAAPRAVRVDPEEVDYLCDSVNRYFARALARTDVIWSYAGIRPLFDDAAPNATAVTRDYVLDIDGAPGEAPLLSVFGGKITTYRQLAEHALQKLTPYLGARGDNWTASRPLYGGDIPDGDVTRFADDFWKSHDFIPQPLARRWVRAYGTCVHRVLRGARSLDDLGAHFGAGLFAAEVDYSMQIEWARTVEDILYRRSKLGLHMPDSGADALARYLGQWRNTAAVEGSIGRS